MTVTNEGKNRRYELTQEGGKFYLEVDAQSIGLTIRNIKHGAMCLGEIRAGEIESVKQIANTQSYQVSYTYQIQNKAEWASFGLKKIPPKVLTVLEGESKTVFKRVLIKSNGGLIVEEQNF